MGLFGKKKPADGAVEPAVEAKQKKPAKQKRGELVKVFNESVWESVNEDFKANKQFVIKRDGKTVYVAFLFDVTQIGGLSTKGAKHDEAKGSIIEAVRTGHIKTYIRNEMLMDDVFVIIPDADTVESMQEYAMLAESDYVLCTVTPDGMLTTETDGDGDDAPEVTVPFSRIATMVRNGGNVMTLFPNSGAKPEKFVDSPFDDAVADEGMEPAGGGIADGDDDDGLDVPDDLGDLDDGLPVDSDPDDDEADDGEPDDEPSGDGMDGTSGDDGTGDGDLPVDGDPDTGNDGSDGGDDDGLPTAEDFGFVPGGGLPPAEDADEGGYDTYTDITEDMVKNFVVRQFYSDDLGLEVSTAPFDAQFVHGNPYQPFNEDRGPGWLNEYLANIAKDANVRMARIHTENLFRMRERYMRLMSAHCEEIAKVLDISSDATQYGKLRFAIEQSFEENMASISGTVASKRQQLEDAWAKELEQVGETAAAQARQEHMLRYGRTHEADLQRLETLERDEVQRDYQNSMKRMHGDRRAEAAKMLDMAVNDTLQEMAQIYLRVLREEKNEYVRLQNEMTRFIDDNRKDEKARIEAIAEENRQKKLADDVRNEYAAKVKAMSAEFEMKKTALQADLDRMQSEHDVELRRLKGECEKRVEAEKAHVAELEAQISDLTGKLANAGSARNEELQGRIDELEAEKRNWSDQLDHVVATHKRANMVSSFFLVAMMVAAIGIGFMLGAILNIRRSSQLEQDALRQQYVQSYQYDRQDVLVGGGNVIDPGATQAIRGSID